MVSEFAKSLLDCVRRAERAARTKPQATASYWNGDSWGSATGFQDAQDWVDAQVVGEIERKLAANESAELAAARDLLRELLQDISRMPVDGPHDVRGMCTRISGFLLASKNGG